MEYYNKNGNLDARWVVREAQNVARRLATDGKEKDEKAITRSQLRKFYREAKSLEQSWINQGKGSRVFYLILPQIKILKAKVAYARAREVVPRSFEEWLGDHVDAIKTPDDFKAFLLHFEAVVGFCYGEGIK